jgi:hypothetical protein
VCINKLFDIYDNERQAIKEDLMKSIDDANTYSESEYHPALQKNLNSSPMSFVDIHKINSECNKQLERARSIQRSIQH